MLEPPASLFCANLSSYMKEKRALAIELQSLLTSHPALGPEFGGEGEAAKCKALEEKLRSLGFAHFEHIDAADARVPSGTRPNLVVTVPGRRKDALWIMSHLDVVPPGELSLWESDPWTVAGRDGKLYGRGVEDNQQGMVSSIISALYFIESGTVPERTIKLLFMADEENGSAFGIAHVLERTDGGKSLFAPGDYIIIPDSGDPAGETIEIAEKSVLWLDVLVHGKQAHGSRPDLGVNAHHAGAALLLKLHALEERFNARDALFEPPPYSTFQATRKTANVPNINTIPAEDFFSMDCRILPCYSLDEVREAIREAVAEIEAEFGVSVEIAEPQATSSRAVAPSSPVVAALSSAVRDALGVKCRPVGIGGGTVAAYLRNKGFDAVVWGIIDDMAHQPNEHCVIESLLKEAAVLACLAMR